MQAKKPAKRMTRAAMAREANATRVTRAPPDARAVREMNGPRVTRVMRAMKGMKVPKVRTEGLWPGLYIFLHDHVPSGNFVTPHCLRLNVWLLGGTHCEAAAPTT
jgi:hypothetical protein